MMKRLLITGGSGLVGSHLISLAQKRYQVHVMYNKNFFLTEIIFSHQLDLVQISQIVPFLETIKPDIIIHTAAISNPDYCELHPDEAETVNVFAMQEMVNWANRNRSKLIFTSTDMVFNGKSGCYRESDKPDPISYYAQTKVRGEELIIKSPNHVIARVALVYGLGIGRQASFFEKMINALKQREKVLLFYDQYRTPILVNNLAEALLDLAEDDFTGIIHLGGSERISRWDFGLKACEILDLPSQFLERASMHDFPAIAFRPPDISLDCNLAKKVLKTKLLNCEQGLESIKGQLNN